MMSLTGVLVVLFSWSSLIGLAVLAVGALFPHQSRPAGHIKRTPSEGEIQGRSSDKAVREQREMLKHSIKR